MYMTDLVIKRGLILGVFVGLFSMAFSQGLLRERLESFKIAHITEELALTTEEAQRFWPVYNEYTQELAELRLSHDKLKRKVRQEMLASGEERLEKLADEYLESMGKKQTIQQQFHQRFKEVLPIRKVLLLYKAEEEFNQKVLTEIAKRRLERRNLRNK